MYRAYFSARIPRFRHSDHSLIRFQYPTPPIRQKRERDFKEHEQQYFGSRPFGRQTRVCRWPWLLNRPIRLHEEEIRFSDYDINPRGSIKRILLLINRSCLIGTAIRVQSNKSRFAWNRCYAVLRLCADILMKTLERIARNHLRAHETGRVITNG